MSLKEIEQRRNYQFTIIRITLLQKRTESLIRHLSNKLVALKVNCYGFNLFFIHRSNREISTMSFTYLHVANAGHYQTAKNFHNLRIADVETIINAGVFRPTLINNESFTRPRCPVVMS